MDLKKYPADLKELAKNYTKAVILSPKNIVEADLVLNSVFTEDEVLKIGRRLLIYELIILKYSQEEIKHLIKSSEKTISYVYKKSIENSKGFDITLSKANKLDKQTKEGSVKKEITRNPFILKYTKQKIDLRSLRREK